MLEKSAISRFADKGEDAKTVTKLIERLREAIVCYQVSTPLIRRHRLLLTGGRPHNNKRYTIKSLISQ